MGNWSNSNDPWRSHEDTFQSHQQFINNQQQKFLSTHISDFGTVNKHLNAGNRNSMNFGSNGNISNNQFGSNENLTSSRQFGSSGNLSSGNQFDGKHHYQNSNIVGYDQIHIPPPPPIEHLHNLSDKRCLHSISRSPSSGTPNFHTHHKNHHHHHFHNNGFEQAANFYNKYTLRKSNKKKESQSKSKGKNRLNFLL